MFKVGDKVFVSDRYCAFLPRMAEEERTIVDIDPGALYTITLDNGDLYNEDELNKA